MFTSTAIKVASTLLFSAPALGQGLGRATLFSDGLSPHVEQSFWDNLVPAGSTITAWDAGTMPLVCYQAANDNTVSPADMEVFAVAYADCSAFAPFIMCRHKDANITQAVMVEVFGMLPVHEREWIQHVVAVPGGGSAYEESGYVVFQGPVGVPSVFQHETGHAVDAYATGAGTSSATDTFTNAIDADSCVPDDYSNSSDAEDYTQNSVLVLYDIVTPGGIGSIGTDTSCLSNQQTAVKNFQGADMQPGGECTRRTADSPTVSSSTGNPVKRSIEGNVVGMDNVFEVPFKHSSGVTTYKNLIFNQTVEAAAEAKHASKTKRAKSFSA